MNLPGGEKLTTCLALDELLKIFSLVAVMDIKLSANELTLFEVYGEENKRRIQNFLEAEILSNKSKALVFSVNLNGIERGTVSFYIYQQNARADYIEKISHVDCLPYELFVILKPIQNQRMTELMFKLLDQKLERFKNDLEKELLLSDKDTLERYLEGPWIGGIQQKQVVYTYKYYKELFDKSIAYIEDGEQRKSAEGQNILVKPFLDLCVSISEKYGFIL